jgi:hypothetical protein
MTASVYEKEELKEEEVVVLQSHHISSLTPPLPQP